MMGKKSLRAIREELAKAAGGDDGWLADRIQELEQRRDENRRTIETLQLVRDALAAGRKSRKTPVRKPAKSDVRAATSKR